MQRKSNEPQDENAEIRENLKWIARISNSHRGPEALNALNKFERAIDDAKFPPLIVPILNRFIQLATSGKVGLNFIPLKAQGHLGYFEMMSNQVYINSKLDDAKLMISTVLHEATHCIIYNRNVEEDLLGKPRHKFLLPYPPGPWSDLDYKLSKAIGDSKAPSPGNLYWLKDQDQFEKNRAYEAGVVWMDELPSRLAEYVLAEGRLPVAQDFSESEDTVKIEAAEAIKKVFETFSKSTADYIAAQKRKDKTIESPISLYKKMIEPSNNPKELKSLIERLRKQKQDLTTMGIYPVHIAVSQGNIPLLIELLATSDFNINEKDKDGNTILHYAILNKNNDIINLLVQLGADIRSSNKEDKNPLALAWEHNKQAIPLVLQSLPLESIYQPDVNNLLKKAFDSIISDVLEQSGEDESLFSTQEKMDNLAILDALVDLGFTFEENVLEAITDLIPGEDPEVKVEKKSGPLSEEAERVALLQNIIEKNSLKEETKIKKDIPKPEKSEMKEVIHRLQVVDDFRSANSQQLKKIIKIFSILESLDKETLKPIAQLQKKGISFFQDPRKPFLKINQLISERLNYLDKHLLGSESYQAQLDQLYLDVNKQVKQILLPYKEHVSINNVLNLCFPDEFKHMKGPEDSPRTIDHR